MSNLSYKYYKKIIILKERFRLRLSKSDSNWDILLSISNLNLFRFFFLESIQPYLFRILIESDKIYPIQSGLDQISHGLAQITIFI